MARKLVNGRVFTGEQTLVDHAVIVDGPDIVAVVPENQAGGVDEVIDLDGNTLVPGLIDLQVNGGGGVLFNDEPSVATISRISDAHRRFGTTALLPALISDTPAKTKSAISAVEAAIGNSGNSVLGIHLEGPFLSPARMGVHNPDFFTQPDDVTIDLVSSLRYGKTLLTLAPEQTTPANIRRLVAAGVIVSAGHTDASYDVIRAALDSGLSGFTHLFNAMRPLGSREPGVVGAALEDQHSWCGVIADGVHVHWAALRIALSAKPRGKVFLVTDAMPPVGAANGEFRLSGKIVRRDGDCLTTADGTLAGSTLDMMSAVRNAVRHLHITWQEAVRMASLYPASFLGLETRYGRIERGFKANMTLIDDQLDVVSTWVLGNRD